MNADPSAPDTTTRLAGHLELTAAPDARGKTCLRRQSFQAPVHLGKGHEDAGTLVLNVVNPTAGLLDGDRLRIEVRVESGARLLLTSPSASRVHTMRAGRAVVSQDFRIEDGGSLEWWPEMLIPQRGARYRQETRIHLAPEAELIFQETLAPGRVAFGEAFEYEELRWHADIRRDGRLAVRERFAITPKNGALAPIRRRFPTGYYTGIFLASPVFGAALPTELATLESDADDSWTGVTQTAGGLILLKSISADSLVLRRTLERVRRTIYRCLDRPAPSLRRAGAE